VNEILYSMVQCKGCRSEKKFRLKQIRPGHCPIAATCAIDKAKQNPMIIQLSLL